MSRKGNRTPRQRKPENEKSRHFQFRLLPKNATSNNDQWLIDLIDNDPDDLRTLIGKMAEQYTNRTPVEPSVIADAYDVLDIRQIVQYIADKLESGEFAPAAGKRRKRDAEPPINEAMRSMLDRHIAGGLLDDDE